MTRKEYFATDAISRSLLMELKKHPLQAKRMIEHGQTEESDALRTGDAFDMMMFDHENVFNEKFHVMQLENLCSNGTTNLGKFMNRCLENISTGHKTEDILYETSYMEAGIKNPKFEEFVESFRTCGGEEYLDEVISSQGKVVLEKGEYENLRLMKAILHNSPYFGKYFVRDLIEGQNRYYISETEEVIYQLVILWDDYKVMLDILHIDHANKRIRPIDLKTTSVKNHDVKPTVIKYDYAYQGGMYHLGTMKWRDENYPEYTIDNFSFIFSEKSCTFAPIMMQMSDTDLNGSIYGGIMKNNRTYQKGILDLITELKWHKENDQWDYDMYSYYNGGCIESDIFLAVISSKKIEK